MMHKYIADSFVAFVVAVESISRTDGQTDGHAEAAAQFDTLLLLLSLLYKNSIDSWCRSQIHA